MIQRALASKGLVAYVLACATGITLYFQCPFPSRVAAVVHHGACMA
jgi:hypothetical protein